MAAGRARRRCSATSSTSPASTRPGCASPRDRRRRSTRSQARLQRRRRRVPAHPDRHRRALAHARADPRPLRRLPAVDPARARRRSRSSRTAPAASSPTPRRPIPDYWVGHLRGTVRFADCIATLAAGARPRLPRGRARQGAELAGPGARRRCPRNQVLSALRHPRSASPTTPTSSASSAGSGRSASPSTGSRSGAARGAPRVPLPTYAFQRSPYFIEPGAAQARLAAPSRPMRAGRRRRLGLAAASGGRGSPTARSTSRPSSTAPTRADLARVRRRGGRRRPRRRRGCAPPATGWSRSTRATPSAAPARTATSSRPSAGARATTRWSATSSRAARCRPASRTSGW